MLRGGKLPKPESPAPGKTGCAKKIGCFLAKYPGNDPNHKIRQRNLERTRVERLSVMNEGDFKSLIRHGWNKELIEVADKKCLHNRIKTMVECEMKANEHLFLEELPKPELKVEKDPEQKNAPEENIKEKENKLNVIKEEEERKLVEEKRLQLFIENSEELRFAAMAKRKKEVDTTNYKTIQEKERASKEQKVKKREMANLEILKLGRVQTFQKNEEKRKIMEKKQQFRMALNEQVQEKENIRKHERELKNIESNTIKKLNEQWNEEEELRKLECIKKQAQRKEEIKQFNEERAKIHSQINDSTNICDATLTIVTRRNSQDDIAEGIDLKAQLRNEYEMFMKYHAMIKGERERQNAEMTNTIMKQRDEIEKLKRSVERKNNEVRQKRAEDGIKALKEQLKSRETLLESQKYMKRQTYEQSVKEYEGYLEEERRLWEKKKQFKWQIKNDLMDQIKSREDIIKKQRKADSENHQKCMLELAKQEELLHKLLNELK